jgi:hypothetical protein
MEWWALLLDLLDDDSDDWRVLTSRPEPPVSLDLRDELCVRCRRPTRYSTPGADGLPTCAACRDELGRPRARGLSCPVDGKDLEPHRVSNVAIDRCPSCGGVWLDGGELELITRAAVQAARRNAQEAEHLLATVLAGLPSRRTSRGVAEELL